MGDYGKPYPPPAILPTRALLPPSRLPVMTDDAIGDGVLHCPTLRDELEAR